MKITEVMLNDRRTTEEYLNGYFSTIECGKADAKVDEAVIKNIDMNKLNSKAEEYFATTLMAGNNIAKMDKQYNRAAAKAENNKLAEEQLSEETEMLNM